MATSTYVSPAQLIAVRDRLAARGFAEITIEYPGVIVVPSVAGYWWIGTVNGTWDGDLCTADGACLGPLFMTGIPASEPDADTIAAAIAGRIQS